MDRRILGQSLSGGRRDDGPAYVGHFPDEDLSHAWANFLLAAGLEDRRDGRDHGPPFNDGDFYKWFEAVAAVKIEN